MTKPEMDAAPKTLSEHSFSKEQTERPASSLQVWRALPRAWGARLQTNGACDPAQRSGSHNVLGRDVLASGQTVLPGEHRPCLVNLRLLHRRRDLRLR